MAPYGRIYGLTDPVTGDVRYVGQTTQSLQDRLCQHATSKQRTHTVSWISSLAARGLRPNICELDTAEDREKLDAAECRWIDQAKAIGWRLTNHRAGGSNGIPDQFARKSMSAGQKRRFARAEEREKTSKSSWGRKWSKEQCLEQSNRCRGRGKTPEHLEHMRRALRTSPLVAASIQKAIEAVRGKPFTEEHKQRLRQARSKQVGRPCSEATREKLRASNLGQKRSEATRGKLRQAWVARRQRQTDGIQR